MNPYVTITPLQQLPWRVLCRGMKWFESSFRQGTGCGWRADGRDSGGRKAKLEAVAGPAGHDGACWPGGEQQ